MGNVRSINWPSTVLQIQGILDGPPSPTQAAIASGVTLRNVIGIVGSDYDRLSTDGILNETAYAASVQAWGAKTQPAWLELDRVCRAIYKLIPPPSNYALAAFGMPTVAPWRPVTNYNPTPTGAGVVPTVSTGFTFAAGNQGVSGVAEPRWNSKLGAQTIDGTITWTCISAITGPSGGQPVFLPWDITLQTFPTLNSRNSAAVIASAQNPGLQELLSMTITAFFAVASTIPAANPTADAASLAVNQAIVEAIANAQAWIQAAAIV